MATQGIVSIVKDGKVIFKCIAGWEGMKAKNLAEEVKKIPFEDLGCDLLYQLCQKTGFGSIESLVVQSENNFCFKGDEDLGPSYKDKEKFNDPKFNPRLESGFADHVKIVKYWLFSVNLELDMSSFFLLVYR